MTPEAVLEQMIKIYGEENLANPEHYPKVFQSQVNLAKWLISLQPSTEVAVAPKAESDMDSKP